MSGNDVTVYWLKLLQQAGIIAAALMIVYFGFHAGMAPGPIVAAISPLLVTLATQLPAADNVKTLFTRRPPPPDVEQTVKIATLPIPPPDLTPPAKEESKP